MTAVDSGRRALQFLGLDEEKETNGFDVSIIGVLSQNYSSGFVKMISADF